LFDGGVGLIKGGRLITEQTKVNRENDCPFDSRFIHPRHQFVSIIIHDLGSEPLAELFNIPQLSGTFGERGRPCSRASYKPGHGIGILIEKVHMAVDDHTILLIVYLELTSARRTWISSIRSESACMAQGVFLFLLDACIFPTQVGH
jgi:hypothetical protein